MRIFEHILTVVKSKAMPGSMGRIVVFIDGIQYAINDNVVHIEELDVERLLEKIEKVLNSNQAADLSKGIKINTIFTEMPFGWGDSRRR